MNILKYFYAMFGRGRRNRRKGSKKVRKEDKYVRNMIKHKLFGWKEIE